MALPEFPEHSLRVTCKNEAAVLERLLRVVRFRGFAVASMNVQLNEQGQFEVLLTVESERPVSLLENQLRKNYDITSVQVVPQAVTYNQGVNP
ncbi:MAG: acetolactate synthase 2 small subunit [Porticoccaceae bacterium]|nr:acetolactate synthase 2 small subunit [Porticoccaceae bacterium]